MRTSIVLWIGLTALLSLALGHAPAQTSYPMITHTVPVAVQRGKTTEITVEGQMNFVGVYKALFEGTGVTAEISAPPPGKTSASPQPAVRSVKLKVTVAADAPLGVREFRLASTLGISSIGQLVVVDDPVFQENGNNNTRASANPVPLPCVVCGRIEALEDVDFFKVQAQAGQVLTLEVICACVQDKIHDLQKHADPMLTLFDAQGRELAANDDFYFADPLLTYTIPHSGDYYIQVRDSKYDGDPRWVYALLVTNRPYVTHLYPMAGNPGQLLPVEPIGSAKAFQPQATLQVPRDLGLGTVELALEGGKTNPAAVLVSALPQVLETEPNDLPDQATRVPIPCGINGRIGTRRDLDHFVFPATKGKAIRFEVKARRFGTVLRSSLDSVLDVLTPKGQVLVSNDDTFGKDAALVFTPPADGDYVLRIRDLNSKGGDTAVYFIEADWARPDFTLRCDPDKAMIGPGSSTAWYVHVVRQNGFTGPVQVEVKGLPKDISVNSLTIPPTMTQGLLVLTASANAVPDATNVQVVGTGTAPVAELARVPDSPTATPSLATSATSPEERLVRSATPNQEIYLPGGGRGRFDVNLHTVAITEASDILQVEVSPRTLTLKPGGEARLDVTLVRRPDYDKGVSLDILLRHLGGVFGNPLPPGVTIDEDRSKTLLGNGNQGHLVLKAAPNAAPIEDVPISVLTHVSVNFVVKMSYSSSPILVTIQK